MKKTSVELELAGKKLKLETGELALQATSSVLARLGDTVVLVTVVEGGKTDLDYFPLSIEYQERLYAGGKIKGSRWVKREGRPSDEAILTGRFIDRSVRPLFPKAFKNEVQVIVTVLSVDGENEADIVALNAVSAAIAISRIPWSGPIGAVRVGCVKENNGEGKTACIINPGLEQQFSDLDLVVSQSKDKTVMIEAGANQIPEDILIEAIEKAHVETQQVIAGIEELVKKAGQKKLVVPKESNLYEVVGLIEKSYKKEVQDLIESRVNKEGGGDEAEALIDKIFEDIKVKDAATEIDKKTIIKAIDLVMFKSIRTSVLTNKKRADGRKMDGIREIQTKVGILPRTHGSAFFQRGITQALSIATLGSPRMGQIIESAEGEEEKRYIHHYSGLPYSFGQAGRVMGASRREIGHGALAEKALEPVIPSQQDFPYTIRVVSEVLSQNGSSSMASTCGSTLALMDAGVPIKKPVAGISIGMMSDGDKYELLTDIIGLEDFSGDMDFKVAGTEDGVTAIQLDVKIDGLTIAQIKETFEKAKTARLEILKKMLSVIPASRSKVSEYAPKIEVLHIPTEKIGEVIGPGGKVIKNIIATTGATVDVEDDGSVAISGTSEESVQKAVDWVKGLTRDVGVGETFEGEVKRILPFGAFVELLPGKEGMVHVSKMSTEYVANPSDIVEIGQKVKVRVVEIDEQGRINLSMLFGADAENKEKERQDRPYQDRPREARSFQPRGRMRGFEPRGQRDFNRRGPNDRQTGSGDHPLSQQFRRERRETWQSKGPRGPRFDKKPRY
ncbi:MAG: polyribonucleotide nucleotidyltransferase [Candidatus Levybacteria bacterium CG10_big_fil_rev_8_21_14_0_10_35_13]|nr:MAG: polyribonucleotide nucleotidyltransferase [Candidatus Levybacteria bacterium CG10_big_fil_rev_8_21_14_0_10_35_13]